MASTEEKRFRFKKKEGREDDRFLGTQETAFVFVSLYLSEERKRTSCHFSRNLNLNPLMCLYREAKFKYVGTV